PRLTSEIQETSVSPRTATADLLRRSRAERPDQTAKPDRMVKIPEPSRRTSTGDLPRRSQAVRPGQTAKLDPTAMPDRMVKTPAPFRWIVPASGATGLHSQHPDFPATPL